MDPFIVAAISVLKERAAKYGASEQADDFKVAFKQTRTLTDLGLKAAQQYRREQAEARG